jgi:hypothetical protein
MLVARWTPAFCLLLGIVALLGVGAIGAAEVTVELGESQGVTLVGAVRRWDQDGNARRKVDTKAKIDAPQTDATADDAGENRWVFKDLPAGKYDLVIVAPERAGKGPLRIEGWSYAPVREFDPFFPPDATTDDETRKLITDHIAKSRQYENKVEPLAMGGDKQAVRVLMMLIRDQPTSYEPGLGSIRHELWQYTYRYGGWQKEQRTHVLDRIMMPVAELRKWTWLWDAKLGGIEVKDSPMSIEYRLPTQSDEKKLKGLHPY